MIIYTFDVGGTGIKHLKFKDQEVIKKDYIKYTWGKKRKTMNYVLELISEKIVDDEPFEIGLSFPGIIDVKNKKVLTESGITDIDINLELYFQKFKNFNKLVIENDGNAAAFGEYNFGIKRNLNTYLNLTIGTAVGGGIVLNGKIHRGTNFKAGELSRLFVNCSERDNSSMLALHAGLGLVLLQHMNETKISEPITGVEFFKLYENGDQLIVKLLDEWISSISKTILNLDYIFDFDFLTIGGGVSENPLFLKLLLKEIKRLSIVKFDTTIFNNSEILNKVGTCSLKNEAGCYGVLALLMGK